MFFTPKRVVDLFTEEQRAELVSIVDEYHGPNKKFYFDDISDREVRRSKKLEKFTTLLEPLAREVFGDPTLKATYSLLLSYDAKSHLVGHHDTNANIYTINYCVRSNVEWPIWFGEGENRIGLDIPEGEALAFMGCDDFHYRERTDQDNADLVLVMFHFCPSDHWYFTKGEGHFKDVQDHFEIVGKVRKEAEDLEWTRDNEKDLSSDETELLTLAIKAKRDELAKLEAMHDRIDGLST
jgi:hypothetical protein